MKAWIRLAILAVAVSLFGGHVANAQIIGLNGGLSLSSLAGDDSEGFESSTGIKAGATATFPLSGNLGLLVGAAFAEKGAELGEGGFGASVAFDYIEVPVLLRLGIPVSGNIAPHVAVGPAIGFMIGCEIGASFEGVSFSADCDEAELETKSIDVGVMANAGVSIATSDKFSVTVDVAYNRGFTSALDGAIDEETPEEMVDVTNRAWSFLVGVAFPIK